MGVGLPAADFKAGEHTASTSVPQGWAGRPWEASPPLLPSGPPTGLQEPGRLPGGPRVFMFPSLSNLSATAVQLCFCENKGAGKEKNTVYGSA